MEYLTPDDTQKLLLAIEQLYSLRDFSSFPTESLAIVDRLVPSNIPAFNQSQPRSGQISFTVLPGYPSLTPELAAVPSSRWHENPIVQHMPDTLYGAYKVSDFITPTELHRLEGLYQQFMRVIGLEDIMTIFLPPAPPENWWEIFNSDVTIAGIALSRTQRNFTERDRLILNLLRPHLLQAFENARCYRSLQQDLAQVYRDLDNLGAILLNGLGQIQFASSLAIELLQAYFPDSTTNRYLPDLVWSWVKHQANTADNQPLDRVRLPLRIEREGKKLTIRAIRSPTENRYFLLLEESNFSLISQLEILGLSQRETEVLALVIWGKDNQTIATELGVNIGTIRKHLERIYSKWGVSSRTEAIAQVLSRLGLFDSMPID